ncbi:UNVERIFIED_CONTAM: hypothetical protein RMT77_002075 [Armadillidium vulgare]
MSKIKNENSGEKILNRNFPLEKRLKKKLNKRQRKLKKKLKDIKKKSKLQKKLKSEKLKKKARNEKMSVNSEPLIHSEQDKISSDQFSSNWIKLKQVISNSKEGLENPRNRKRTLDINSNNSEIISDNRNMNNKHLTEKKKINVNSTESDVIPLNGEKTIVQPNVLKAENSFTGFTKAVAIDCEMVGGGLNGEIDILARVSIVNQFGNVLYDKYVKPRELVLDYRTEFSGIRPENLVDAESFEVVQKEVDKILCGKIVVGHGLKNDFQCLYISHPKNMIRDTSKFKPFRKIVGRGTPSLKKLCDKILEIKIQSGEHDSIQDARAAMRLYSLHRKEWEKEVPKIKKNLQKN